MAGFFDRIKGSFTALISPFKDGAVDEAAFGRLVDWQISEGTHGLVPVGTTGESPTLSHAEHMRVVELCVQTAAGRVPIVAGAGSDEMIEAVFRCCIEAGERIVISSPTFGMYSFDAQQYGAEVVDVPRREDWELDREPLLAAARDAKAVFLPSPNNPTGNTASRELIEELLETGALIVIDEAYIEFSEEESVAALAASGAPLVVLRTFSKWGGLAGMRIGYAVMPEALAQATMAVKQPYSLNVAAEVAALASLQDIEELDERACTITGERNRLAKALRATGWVEPWPSDTNFLFCRLLRSDGATVREVLRRRGVIIRYFDSERLRGHIRISVGTAEDTDRVIEALAKVAQELGAEA